MKWKAISVAITGLCLASISASAQTVDNKFENVDNLLKSLSKMSQPIKIQSTTDSVDELNNSPIPPLVEKPAPILAEHLTTSILDIPPYSRFEFNRDVIIPAYRSGVLFEDGELKFNVEEGAVIEMVVAQRQLSNCVLSSNKNYLIMRSASISKPNPSFVDTKNVELLEVKIKSGGSRYVFKMNFFEKTPKGSKDTVEKEVDISLTCSFDMREEQKINDITVNDINKITGDLFTVDLPEYIEI